ncbi:MAG TPA: hypothetical protein VFG72_05105 [Marmoricola sp.]|nr:hypothetical protein [Marmoricola sp.]
MTSSRDPLPPAASRPAAPPPLTVAVVLALLEGAVLALYGLSLLPSLEGERLAMGVSAVLFFALYGGFLGYCAVQLYRLRSWARPPLVLAQLMQILVGASFWGGSTTVIAIVAVTTAVLAIAGVFHPASLAAVERDDPS